MASLRLHLYKNFTKIIRNYSSKHPTGAQNLVDKIAITEDGSTFVTWHPKPEFPYECTKPIPKAAERDNSSLIKESAINKAMQAFKTKHPEAAREELMRLTFTTKHRWFPRARDKRAKKSPMDRQYL